MSDTPTFDPATTAAAEAPSQPMPPAVQAALDAAIARIEALEKQVATLGVLPATPLATPPPGGWPPVADPPAPVT